MLPGRIRALNRGEPETDGQPPVGLSILAGLVCYAPVFAAGRPAEALFGTGWIELLHYPLLPVTVTFMILYRSCWHPEITGVPRTCSLLLISGLVFCGIFLATGMMLAIGCLFAIVYQPNMGP